MLKLLYANIKSTGRSKQLLIFCSLSLFQPPLPCWNRCSVIIHLTRCKSTDRKDQIDTWNSSRRCVHTEHCCICWSHPCFSSCLSDIDLHNAASFFAFRWYWSPALPYPLSRPRLCKIILLLFSLQLPFHQTITPHTSSELICSLISSGLMDIPKWKRHVHQCSRC